ncbi:unnamed protein product [Enterobius vermicularis]|uniref:t-SNARE coiled-coil homology domain-containing protein n=1 Tax=Enterobius vermicularis TaxID=51028 RepID=A0A0N4VE48_ENTVE|nr:unnamed protein product [Enterobius vermicularis]
MSYRGSSNGASRYGDANDFMERQNDDLVEKLSSKVAALKKITIAIGDDVRDQNRLLNEVDSEFDASKSLLGSTMKRLGIVARSGGGSMLCYLVLFSLFVFFIIYYLAR